MSMSTDTPRAFRVSNLPIPKWHATQNSKKTFTESVNIKPGEIIPGIGRTNPTHSALGAESPVLKIRRESLAIAARKMTRNK